MSNKIKPGIGIVPLIVFLFGVILCYEKAVGNLDITWALAIFPLIISPLLVFATSLLTYLLFLIVGWFVARKKAKEQRQKDAEDARERELLAIEMMEAGLCPMCGKEIKSTEEKDGSKQQ